MSCSHHSSGHRVLIEGLCPACLLSGVVDDSEQSIGDSTAVRPIPNGRLEPSLTRSLHFSPGTIIAERFRITGLIGRGGMGEVYRADDLKLGEPVALKFLAAPASFDRDRLRFLYEEVRLGRRLAHPNLCRIYELLEFAGVPFIVMEHVDGEDLASLLARIGRPSNAKALEIARDLCAGLDAIHQQQIVHGDLKPANVMLDGRGRIRVTDFGLARRLEGLSGSSSGGTPCYMAPEQFSGGVVSVATDIYALGLILYETFTGKRLHDVDCSAELEKSLEEGPPAASEFPADVDPRVESAIVRCLEPDPSHRPPSVRSVMNELPVMDAVDAMVHAGQTPPPDLVLSAGGHVPRLRNRSIWLLLVICTLLLAAVAATSAKLTLYGRFGLVMPTDALAERARTILIGLGFPAPANEAWWFETDLDRLRTIAATGERDRWSRWGDGFLSGVRFHYRGAPGPLLARGSSRKITVSDPPFDQPGMTHLTLSPKGNLVSFRFMPRLDDLNGAPPGNRLPQLLQMAGVETGSPASVSTAWIPPVGHDARFEWRTQGTTVRAATLTGIPTWFEVVGDRNLESRKTRGEVLPHRIYLLILLTTLIPCLIIARRNIRHGRIDRRGATVVTSWVFALHTGHRLLMAHHPWRLDDEIQILVSAISASLLFAAQIWLGYAALEPYVRRYWPGVILGWLRLLHGRQRDAIIGRELLFGMMCGLAIRLVDQVRNVLPELFPSVRSIPSELAVESLTSVRIAAGWILQSATQAVYYGLVGAIFLIVLRLMTRRRIAASALWLILVTAAWSRWEDPRVDVPIVGLQMLLLLVVLERIGLLAMVTALFTHILTVRIPITADPNLFYFPQSLLATSVLALLGFHAVRSALRGHERFGHGVIPEVT